MRSPLISWFLTLCAAAAALLTVACKTDDAAQTSPTQTPTASDPTSPPTPPTSPPQTEPKHGPLRALIPPSTPGESKVAIAGCLKEGAKSDTDGDRFPAPPENARSGPGDKPDVQLSVLGDGVLVNHTLNHACCLTAEVTSKLDGQTLKITEKLSGNPCRCRCQSSIQTAVGLPLGAYQVEVEVIQNDQSKTVHTQPVEIKSLRTSQPPTPPPPSSP